MKNRVNVSKGDTLFFGATALVVFLTMLFIVWFDFTHISSPGVWVACVLGLLPFLLGSILAMFGILEITGPLIPSISFPKLRLPRRKQKGRAEAETATPAS